MREDELLKNIPLFESLQKDARDFIIARLKNQAFYAGEVICRQGETGDSLYIMTSGLVRATKREKDGGSLELARFQIGDYFGEMSLLAGQPRSADIIAITDTTTFVLYKHDLDEIIKAYPTIAVNFSKILSKRLREASQLQLQAKRPISVVAVYSRHVDSLLQAIFAVNLSTSFLRELMKSVLLIDLSDNPDELPRLLHEKSSSIREDDMLAAEKILEGTHLAASIRQHQTGLHIFAPVAQAKFKERIIQKDLRPVIDTLKGSYKYILINCAKNINRLTQSALETADTVVYLSPDSDEAIQRCKKDADSFVQGHGDHSSLLIAVLKKEQTSPRIVEPPAGKSIEEILAPHSFCLIQHNTTIVDRFLKTGRPFVYEYPKSNIARSIQHLTRRIGRVRVGLALGSGAARGFAHVGVLKKLDANDIPIDMIAGSSMGALVGGFYAAGVSITELEEMVLGYMDKRKVRRTIFDLTIPRYGLSKGNRLSKFMRSSLGDLTFDDLSIPFIAVATDISNGNEVVLNNGIVWKALRASGSVPVMFEPYYLDGHYLIDGGITNPLPTDLLIERDVDIIISCTVNSVKAPSKTFTEKTRFVLHAAKGTSQGNNYGIFDALTRSMGIMSAANSLQKARLADIDIRPNVAAIDWVDFHRGDELMHAGERAAEEVLPAILGLLHGENSLDK